MLFTQGQNKILILDVFFSLHASAHPLPCLSFFHSSLFTRLIINRVFFNLFYYCLLLDFSFESFKSALNGFAIFNDDKCQKYSPPFG